MPEFVFKNVCLFNMNQTIKSILIHEYQHKSTRVNTNQHKFCTNQHEFDSSQHEFDTSRHESNTNQHESKISLDHKK